jgi:hypothetical protein
MELGAAETGPGARPRARARPPADGAGGGDGDRGGGSGGGGGGSGHASGLPIVSVTSIQPLLAAVDPPRRPCRAQRWHDTTWARLAACGSRDTTWGRGVTGFVRVGMGVPRGTLLYEHRPPSQLGRSGRSRCTNGANRPNRVGTAGLRAARPGRPQDPKAAVDVAGQDQLPAPLRVDAPDQRQAREEAARVAPGRRHEPAHQPGAAGVGQHPQRRAGAPARPLWRTAAPGRTESGRIPPFTAGGTDSV